MGSFVPLRFSPQGYAYRDGVPFRAVLVLFCRGGRLCPPCMTAAPCRAGPVCPAVTGVGIRLSSPPSEREVSARSADGGRDATRFLSPSRLCRQPPPRGGLTARRRRAVIARRGSAVAIRPPPAHPPSKSQQFPTKFCTPIQNVKISPETVADCIRRCYI